MLINNKDKIVDPSRVIGPTGYTGYQGYTGATGPYHNPGHTGTSNSYDMNDDPEVIASETNRVIVRALPTELQLDIDSIHRYNTRLTKNREVMDHILLTGGLCLSSWSTGHFHIYLAMIGPLSEAERICLQSLLGSDQDREDMNTRRLTLTGSADIMLFESKANALEIAAWRSTIHREA